MPAPQTEVLITVAGSEHARYVFAPGDYIIGHNPDCHIRVDADRVSGTHAKLILNYDYALIEALASSNGIQVNGQPVTGTTRLWPSQKIQVGSATIELRRLKVEVSDQSLAPTQAVVRRVLPEEFLREKKYDIGKVVARGGMGAILDAKESAIERTVAMKVMLDSNSPDDLLRFLNEAKVTGQLEHPNIVPVHELSVDENGQPFYTMKMVRGVTLKKVLDQLAAESRSQESGDRSQSAQTSLTPDSRPLTPSYPLPVLLTIFQKVCDALAFAHSKGVIHRDLKPENIMLGDFGEALLMDWGLAKRMRNPDRGTQNEATAPDEDIRTIRHTVAGDMPASPELDPATLASTLAGSIMGTPQFMSPEQARGEVATLDARSDIYSLGAILYQILTLRPPVTGKDAMDIVRKVARGEIEPLVGPPRRGGPDHLASANRDAGESVGAPGVRALPRAIPESLAAVVKKAMSLDPAARYASVGELQADILAYQNGFATGAEQASLMKQILLLIQRHKGVFITAFAAWALITALAVWFVISIRASERETRRQAEIAAANQRTATRNAEIAQANEKRAVASEQEAVAEKENVRRALAKSALALAEAAYREANGPAMQAALDTVPADLRDANWSYLLEQSDMSIARLPNVGSAFRFVAAHPKLPSVFAITGENPTVIVVNARTGERLLQFDVALKASQGRSLQIAFSPDGERIAVGQSGTAGESAGIAIHSARDGSKLLAWESPGVSNLAFSPDGRHLLQLNRNLVVTGDRGQSLILWDATNGRHEWSYKSDAGRLLRGGFTPDGRQVLAALGFGRPVLLKMEDGTASPVPGIDIQTVDAFAIRPDGLAFLWGNGKGDVLCGGLKDKRLLFSVHTNTTGNSHMAFTPDGERFVFVAGLSDGRQSILVCSARTGAVLQSLVGGSGAGSDIAIHPLSGEMLVLGSTPRLWDVSGLAPRWSLDSLRDDFSMAGASFLGADDLFLGPVKGSRTVLIGLSDLSVIWKPSGTSSLMPSASADGRFFALANILPGKAIVQMVRQESGNVSPVGDFEARNVRALRMKPSGDRLLIVPKGAKVRLTLLDSSTGKEVLALDRKFLQEINDMQWIGADTQIIGVVTARKPRGVSGSEEWIVVWDATSGQKLRNLVYPAALDCIVVAPDGKSFAAAGADKLVHVFDMETLKERQAFRAHDGPISALAWHPTRPILATGSEDFTIKLWNLETDRRLETFRGPTAAPRVLNFSPSGQRLACASADRMVRIWEPPSLNNATLDAPKTDGWEDLLAKLKADDVKANGNGWTLSGGVLVSPDKHFSALPIGENLARSSYELRITLRRLNGRSFFAAVLPVGAEQVSFFLDNLVAGCVSGLATVEGETIHEHPNVVRGQQITDAEPHDLEITVRLAARTARIIATLDDRPIYEWSGNVDSLKNAVQWGSLPQSALYLGASTADWVVSAVKVKRLEK